MLKIHVLDCQKLKLFTKLGEILSKLNFPATPVVAHAANEPKKSLTFDCLSQN